MLMRGVRRSGAQALASEKKMTQHSRASACIRKKDDATFARGVCGRAWAAEVAAAATAAYQGEMR
jgi:hypothetical protein